MDDAHGHKPDLRTIALTVVAMLAFAANSLLCRRALQQEIIDPASFGSIRLVSGALTLAVIVRVSSRCGSATLLDPRGGRAGRSPALGAVKTGRATQGQADWLAAAMLFVYVAFFSFAYLSLSAGTGALVLFGAVQLTMFGAGLRAGEAFSAIAWIGLALAVAGLVYLVSPGLAAPPLLSATLMAIAGVAWGVYSLRGRGVADPLAATARNFIRAVPFALTLSLILWSSARADAFGVALAVASGAITSAMGYVIWYAALPGLTAMRAATVQLSVPLIAAFGGVVFLSEAITPRLLVASCAILGGIGLVLASRSRGLRVRRQE